MKLRTIAATLAALLLGFALGRAEEITLTTIHGRTITKAELSRVEPDGLVLMTSDGIEKIPFTILSAELQQKYGYDPSKASIYSASVAAARRLQFQKMIEIEKSDQMKKDAEVFKHAGDLAAIERRKARDKAIRAVSALGVAAQIRIQQLDGANALARISGADEPVWIYGVSGVVDGDWMNVTLYPTGKAYQYMTVLGAQKTVRSYATSPERAVSIISEE